MIFLPMTRMSAAELLADIERSQAVVDKCQAHWDKGDDHPIIGTTWAIHEAAIRRAKAELINRIIPLAAAERKVKL